MEFNHQEKNKSMFAKNDLKELDRLNHSQNIETKNKIK